MTLPDATHVWHVRSELVVYSPLLHSTIFLYRVEHAVMQTHMRGCAHKSASSLVLKKRGVDDGGGGVCVVYIVPTPF